MSHQNRVLEEQNPFRIADITQDEENTLIDLYEDGNHDIKPPAEMDYDRLWADESNRSILVELFYKTQNQDALFTLYNERMYNYLEIKANQQKIDKEQLLIKFYNPYNAKMGKLTMYRSLNRLLSFGLVKYITHTVSHDRYYSLTSDIGVPQVTKCLALAYYKYWDLLRIFLDNKNWIYRIRLMTSWVESYYRIERLICLIDAVSPETAMLPSEIITMYTEYLVRFENEHRANIDRVAIHGDVMSRLNRLMQAGYIQQLDDDKIILTESGMQLQEDLTIRFSEVLGDWRRGYLIEEPQTDRINLTNVGITVIQTIMDRVYTDEARLIKPPASYVAADLDTVGKPIPIHLQMQKLRAMHDSRPEAEIYIQKRDQLGWRQEFVHIIGKRIGAIGGLMAFSFMVIMIGLWLLSIEDPFGSPTLVGGVIVLVLDLSLLIMRKKWDQPDYIQEAQNGKKHYILRGSLGKFLSQRFNRDPFT